MFYFVFQYIDSYDAISHWLFFYYLRWQINTMPETIRGTLLFVSPDVSFAIAEKKLNVATP